MPDSNASDRRRIAEALEHAQTATRCSICGETRAALKPGYLWCELCDTAGWSMIDDLGGMDTDPHDDPYA